MSQRKLKNPPTAQRRPKNPPTRHCEEAPQGPTKQSHSRVILRTKPGVWFLVIVMAAGALSGCATVKKKFIRKTPERQVQPVVYTEETSVKQYTNKYYYTSHFSYWKTWQDELLGALGQNAKKERRAMDDALSHLEGMQKYLIAPKNTELGVQIAEVREASRLMDSGGGGTSNASIRLKLERTRRIINSGFYYDKVKDFIAPDANDLGPSEPPPASP